MKEKKQIQAIINIETQNDIENIVDNSVLVYQKKTNTWIGISKEQFNAKQDNVIDKLEKKILEYEKAISDMKKQILDIANVVKSTIK